MIRFGHPRSPLPDGRYLDDFDESDGDLEFCLRQWRWPESNGEPICPHCGGGQPSVYRSRPIYKCSNCKKQFSITSGTLLAYHKISVEIVAFIIAEMSVNPCAATARKLAAGFDLGEGSAMAALRMLRAANAGAGR
jgi:hypothetical protein